MIGRWREDALRFGTRQPWSISRSVSWFWSPAALAALLSLALAMLVFCLLPVMPCLWVHLRRRRRSMVHGPHGGYLRRAAAPTQSTTTLWTGRTVEVCSAAGCSDGDAGADEGTIVVSSPSHGRSETPGRSEFRDPFDGGPDEQSLLVSLSHGETHVQVNGAHNPGCWVVLIHGNVGSTSYLNGLAECLADSRRMMRYDLFGRGFSGCGGWEHTHHLFSGQLAELLFRLRVDAPIQLVGYSLGAQVAVHFAALWPDKVSKLVLLCPAVAVPPALPVLLQLTPVRHLFGHIVRLLLQDPAYFAADWRDLRSSDCRARNSALEKVHSAHVCHMSTCIFVPLTPHLFLLRCAARPHLSH